MIDHLAAYAAMHSHGNVPPYGNVQIDHLAAHAALLSHGNDPDEPYVTKMYVARRFKMSYSTIERNMADGMPWHPIGKRGVRFIVSEIQRWLDTNARKRFAATGRAITKAELQRRIVMIPLLDGLEIVDKLQLKQDDKAKSPPNKERDKSQSSFMPRCKRGRKRTTPEKVACDDRRHKWSKGRYTRTCAVCGITQERDPNDQWIAAT